MEPISKLLRKHSQEKRQRIMSTAVVIAAAESELASLFGASAASGMRVVSFYLGTLKVSCERPVVAQEAAIRADELAAAVNARLGAPAVRRVIVR
jgi:hypothetical protein